MKSFFLLSTEIYVKYHKITQPQIISHYKLTRVTWTPNQSNNSIGNILFGFRQTLHTHCSLYLLLPKGGTLTEHHMVFFTLNNHIRILYIRRKQYGLLDHRLLFWLTASLVMS